MIPCFDGFVNKFCNIGAGPCQRSACPQRGNAVYYDKQEIVSDEQRGGTTDERTAGAASAPQNTGRGLWAAASAGTGAGVPPHHRKRKDPQHDLLRPLRHRQDHRGPHHCRKQRDDPPQAQRHLLRHRRHQGGPQGHRHTGRGRGHPALPRRDPVPEQKAAAEPVGVHRGRQRHPHRLHHRKPLLLHL